MGIAKAMVSKQLQKIDAADVETYGQNSSVSVVITIFTLLHIEMAAFEEISLRPLSLKPGAANPFASFAHGAGVGLKSKVGYNCGYIL